VFCGFLTSFLLQVFGTRRHSRAIGAKRRILDSLLCEKSRNSLGCFLLYPSLQAEASVVLELAGVPVARLEEAARAALEVLATLADIDADRMNSVVKSKLLDTTSAFEDSPASHIQDNTVRAKEKRTGGKRSVSSHSKRKDGCLSFFRFGEGFGVSGVWGSRALAAAAGRAMWLRLCNLLARAAAKVVRGSSPRHSVRSNQRKKGVP